MTEKPFISYKKLLKDLSQDSVRRNIDAAYYLGALINRMQYLEERLEASLFLYDKKTQELEERMK